jgi:hypothetical protein
VRFFVQFWKTNTREFSKTSNSIHPSDSCNFLSSLPSRMSFPHYSRNHTIPIQICLGVNTVSVKSKSVFLHQKRWQNNTFGINSIAWNLQWRHACLYHGWLIERSSHTWKDWDWPSSLASNFRLEVASYSYIHFNCRLFMPEKFITWYVKPILWAK